jgi:bifunctional oligoribonuclease and PAP phosphatase NrnA
MIKRRIDPMSDCTAVSAALQSSKTVLISVHVNPDGDALGAQLALLLALEKSGKTVTAHNLDPVPEIYRFLPHADRIKTGRSVEGKYDVYVVLDAEPARTGLFDANMPAGKLINIDHHVTNQAHWPLTWLDPNAAATGEMIYKIIQNLGVPIDRDIALCLYTSIFTDTGSFRYSNTSPESMRIAATLLEAGADPWLVTENVYESFAFRRLQLLGSVLAGIERSADGRIAWVVVTDELYRKTQTSSEDTDNFVNFVRSAKGVEVAVLFRQTGEAEFKISMRSKGRVDLSGLAVSLGGGGHKNAAGSVLKGALNDVTTKVLHEIDRTVVNQLGDGALHPA